MNGKLIRQTGSATQTGAATFALTLLLAFSIASASGGGAQGGGGSAQGGASAQTGGGSGDQSGGSGDMVQIRDRDRVSDQTSDRSKDRTRDGTRDLNRTRDRELDRELLFKDSEGKVHQWRERFNHRLQKYETKDDPEGLARALQRVANRYRLPTDEDTGGFVDWALKNRPWAEVE